MKKILAALVLAALALGCNSRAPISLPAANMLPGSTMDFKSYEALRRGVGSFCDLGDTDVLVITDGTEGKAALYGIRGGQYLLIAVSYPSAGDADKAFRSFLGTKAAPPLAMNQPWVSDGPNFQFSTTDTIFVGVRKGSALYLGATKAEIAVLIALIKKAF